jgi:hypothetical protein
VANAEVVDFFIKAVTAKFDKLDIRMDKQDDKLDQLFTFRWMILGGAAAIGTLGGFVAATATLYFYSKGLT